jgi:hypothetical protein
MPLTLRAASDGRRGRRGKVLAVIEQMLKRRNHAAAQARPEHALAQADALLPRGFLLFFAVALPVALADHAEEGDEVAGGAQPAETVVAERLRSRVVFGGAKVVFSDMRVRPSTLAAKRTRVVMLIRRENFDREGPTQERCQYCPPAEE